MMKGHSPKKLGSWTRPSTLNMDSKGTMPSPWTVGKGMQGKQMQEENTSTGYPWVFYDPDTEEKKAVIYSQALYQRDNINVV